MDDLIEQAYQQEKRLEKATSVREFFSDPKEFDLLTSYMHFLATQNPDY